MSICSVDSAMGGILYWFEHWAQMQVHGYPSLTDQASKHQNTPIPGCDGGVEMTP